MTVAHKPKHHSTRRGSHPLGGLPSLPPLQAPASPTPNIWAVLGNDGSAGILTLPLGKVPMRLSNGTAVLYATKIGTLKNKKAAYSRFVKWTRQHASFIGREGGQSSGARTIFNDGLRHGGAFTHVKGPTGDPIPGILFVTAVTAGAATALGIPGAIAGGEAGGAAAGAEAGAAGAAAGGAEAGAAGAGGVGAGTVAAGVGAATVAGMFTNISWWKGAGMVVIGVVLGVLAIREFSP